MKKILFNISHWCFGFRQYAAWMDYYLFGTESPDMYSSKKLQEVRTSGSSGSPRRFFLSGGRIASSFALVDYRFKQIGFRPWHKFVKIWYPTTGHSWRKLLMERLDRMLRKEKFFSYFDLVSGKKTIGDLVSFIQKHKPNFIEGYAGGLIALATYIKENHIKIPRAYWIVTGAGQVRPEQHKLLEEELCVHHFDRYGCTEFGEIAHQLPGLVGYEPNPNLNLFVAKEVGDMLVRLEAAPDGEYEIFVSDKREPSIFDKYRMKDVVEVKNHRIMSIQGRTEKMYDLGNGDFLPTGFFYQAIKDFTDIKQFQVVYDRTTKMFTVKTSPRALNDKEQVAFQKYFGKRDCGFEYEKENFEVTGRRKKIEEIVIK